MEFALRKASVSPQPEDDKEGADNTVSEVELSYQFQDTIDAIVGFVEVKMDNIRDFLRDNENYRKIIFYGICIVVGLIIILPIASLCDLEYYEIGFAHNKASGKVDTSKVYQSGRYMLGPMVTFKVFRSDMHYEYLSGVTIFNKEKLEVEFSCSFLYKLRQEHLKNLHDTYNLEYRPIVRSAALATLKGAATKYSVDDYRMERQKVKLGLAKELSKVLGGDCCRANCTICYDGCETDFTKCTRLGYYVELKHFHLHLVTITKDQEKRFLQQVVEQEKEDTEFHTQNEKIARIETEHARQKIVNQAKEISEQAVAQSEFIMVNATIEAKRIKSDAANNGLKQLYTSLDITNTDDKKKLDYVRTLTNSKQANIYVGFEYMVANPAKP